MKTQKLWITALIVAGYCSLALDAIPVGNTNNKTVSETGSGGCINNVTVDETGNDITNATLHEIGSGDNIDNAVATVKNRLSPTDIEQVNRLYSCPGPGKQGFLTIYIRNGVNLEDTDNVIIGAHTYVIVKAISSTGTESHRKTSYKKGTQYPTWNEWLLFSDKQWQFFRIRVWDSDISSRDDPIGMSETIPLLNQSRNSTQQKHCTNTACDRYILFDYNIMLLTPVRGYLWVKVNYARNLPDTDNTLNGDPDPYTSVRVIMPDGSSSSKQTTYMKGTRNPTWNQWLEMSGCDESAVFTVQVWDDDTFSDEKMSTEGLFEVASGSHTSLRHCLSNDCNAYLYLDYKTLIPREHAIRAYLHVKVRYAHNLPDTDNTLNGDPDPYVRVTAFWCSGSDSRETSCIQGTRYPSWNEWLGMGGCHNFVGFKAQVWDDDIFSDEEMFTPEPFEVALGSHSNIKHCVSSNCLSYLYLDYKLLIPVYGHLRVKIRYAYNLPDADGFLGGDPDPYVHVTAFSCSGSISKQTHYIQGTKNPTWNRWLEMSGCHDFTGFKVQVWDDDDTSSNDKMSDEQLFEVALGSHSSIKHCITSTCNSYMYLDYKLHVPNVRGLLRIKVRSAHNLPDADGFLGGDPDPYVRVTAFSCSGSSSQQTSYIQGTKNPTWNQWLVMSGCSKFAGFEVQVWDDDDTSSDDVMSSLEFFEVSSGYHSSIRHCVTSSCHSYLYLDYELTPDGNECNPNPCQNGGTCTDGCLSYSCSCTSSYTGDQCQYRQGRLTFYARYGSNLPDEDGWFAGDSDPYMKFVACDAHGNCYEKTSNVDEGDEDPEWHQHIDFGIRTWRRFEVSVWDDDGILSDDRLSNTHTWYLPSTTSASATFVTLNAYEGFVKFDYTYT